MIATVISYPNNTLNESFDLGNSLISSELVKNITIDVIDALGEEYIEIVYNGGTITLLIEEECRYTPIDIFYQNKEGAIATFTFFKKTVESLDVTDEMFESDRGQPINGNHQFVKYNIQGKQKFTTNTGFIAEEQNEVIKQMLFSERVWKYENDILVPLNITSKSLEYKTRANDRLINYTISFEYAFNEKNNI